MRLVVSFLAALLALGLPPVSSVAAAEESGSADPCNGSTTPAINQCFGNKLQAAEAVMDRYFQAAVDRYQQSGDDAVVMGLRDSQRAFATYREIECGAVYERWKSGTIRAVMELNCSIALTEQRTHAIWASWLTYPDGTPPTLSEPTPTP